MENQPVSVIFNGTTINNIINFRFGQQLNEQRKFELKFKQPQVGSAFTFGFDDPDQYSGKPIVLKFDDKELKGTVSRVEFVQSPGYEAEVIITGYVNWASNNQQKFNLLAAGTILMPLLFIGLFIGYISHQSNTLVKKQATVKTFRSTSGRGGTRYIFKTKEYAAGFTHSYGQTFRHVSEQRMTDIFGPVVNDTPIGDTTQVSFYIALADESKLSNANANINYFYLQAKSKAQDKNDYYLDLIADAFYQTGSLTVFLIFFALTIVCNSGAYYYYQWQGLKATPKNVIIYRTSFIIAIVFNIVLILLF
jgi:hypothetical protein